MKKQRRAMAVFLLIFTLSVSMALSGCGKKTVDYEFGEGDESGGNTEGDLSARLGIPKSYEGEIPVGESGLSKITIQDEDIQVPSTDGMSIVHAKKNLMDAGYRQTVAETIFDRSGGIYRYDWDVSYKQDVEVQMQIYQMLLDNANDIGDTANASWYEQYLEELQTQYDDAVEEREGPGDWSALDYVGKIGSTQFRLSFSPSENGLSSYFSFSIHPYESQILYRPYAGATQAFYYTSLNEDGQENRCSWSAEEAAEIAEDFLNDCGIQDVVLDSVTDLLWDYTDASLNTIASELDGYLVTFTRAVNGCAPYQAYFFMVDNLQSGDTFFVGGPSYETYSVYLDDNGIFAADCFDLLLPPEETENNVDLLSWDEILEIADTAIPNYYIKYPTSFNALSFNDIRLTYYLVKDEEEDTYQYIPVWVFAQIEEYEGEYNDDSPTQVVMINAVTGDVIDLPEMMNQNGTGAGDNFYDEGLDDDMFVE